MSGKFGTRKITAHQMVALERVFRSESNDADGLDVEQFVEVFQSVLGGDAEAMVVDAAADTESKTDSTDDASIEDANHKRYLTHLFMKIDANSDGTVDWEEFLNFLLMENQGLESSAFDQQKDTLVRETMHCDNYHSNHSDMIGSVLHFPQQSRYVTGSLDGTIKLWDTQTYQIKKTVLNSPTKSWVMDLAYLPLSKQVAAVCMDGIVNIYNASSWKLNSQIMNKAYVLGDQAAASGDAKKFSKEEQRWLISSTPVCAHGAMLNETHELLSVGTECGKAFLYLLDTPQLNGDGADDANAQFHVCSGDQSMAPNQVSLKNKMYKWSSSSSSAAGAKSHRSETELSSSSKNEQIISPVLACSHLQPFRHGVEPRVMHVHNDWITHIEYTTDLQSLVTCSLDSQLRFSDIERRKKTRMYMGHLRGVHHFAYNPEFKFMASCGVERKIHIFDPHRCARLQLLIGHTTSVSRVLMNEARHQLISLSQDKVIKIWDTRTFRCLQTLHDNASYQPDNRISAIMFDNDNKRLITCSSRLQAWPARFQTQKSQIKSHDGAVSSAYFNKHFEQCVSSDFNGNIHVWDIESSARVFRYSVNAAENETPKEKVTALAFDTSKRRVVTGTDHGTLQMWNFSSGQCLCEFRDYHSKYAHWRDSCGSSDGEPQNEQQQQQHKQYGTEITDIVYVMAVTSWTAREVQHWIESLRDKEVRSVGETLIAAGVNGSEMLELNHDTLQKEFRIDDIVQRRKMLNAISGLYQSNVAARYIVSVGWDNKLRVWMDSSNMKGVQHPITVMPSEHSKRQSHQIEILCLTHYPSSYVVTGGADGSIVIWNVVSGVFERKLVYPSIAAVNAEEDCSCTQVSWLAEYKLIVSAHSNGCILFWDPNRASTKTVTGSHAQNCSHFGFRHTTHRRNGGITCMVTAKQSTLMVTGDNAAMLQIFCLSQFEELDMQRAHELDLKCHVKRVNVWYTGHVNGITCIDYLDSKDLLLTCGHDQEVLLWTSDGVKIGMFGQKTLKAWNLNDRQTFIDRLSRSQVETIADESEVIDTNTQKQTQDADGTCQSANNDTESGNSIKIHNDTLQLLQKQINYETIEQNRSENDTVLANPELHAILQKPTTSLVKTKTKKKSAVHSVLNQHLKTFALDEIPKESPFK